MVLVMLVLVREWEWVELVEVEVLEELLLELECVVLIDVFESALGARR